tara:strand:+ start:6045 stop:6755 length:711 start_codon:yes stop_codon:yes gene_type:complete
MADRNVTTSNTLEEFRVEFNELAVDVGDIASVTGASGQIASATDIVEAVVALNSGSATAASPTFTGVASFADGTAGAPSITNTGDTNTGIFFGGADQVDVSVGGTGIVSVTSTGMAVTGNISATGNITMGDADTDNITFNADVNSNIVPNAHDSFSLGIDTKSWQNLFLSNGIVFEGTGVDAHETTVVAANPTADATVTIPNETGTVVTTATTDAGLATSTISTKGFSIAMAVALG